MNLKFKVLSLAKQSFDDQLLILENESARIEVHLKAGNFLPDDEVPKEVDFSKFLPEPKAEVQSEVKLESEPEPKAEVRPEAKEVKLEPEVESQPAQEAQPPVESTAETATV